MDDEWCSACAINRLDRPASKERDGKPMCVAHALTHDHIAKTHKHLTPEEAA